MCDADARRNVTAAEIYLLAPIVKREAQHLMTWLIGCDPTIWKRAFGIGVGCCSMA